MTKIGGTLTLDDAARTTVSLAKCHDFDRYWSCLAATFSNNGFCGQPANTPLQVYVLKATVKAGKFDFSQSSSLTVVCGGNHDAPVTISCDPNPPPEPFSVAGDCLEWGYRPTKTDQGLFNSCIRMARADYLGNGWSATRYGTKIMPYGGFAFDVPSCTSDCNACFEAFWYEGGGFCISHQRWEDILARLEEVLGLQREDARNSLEAVFPLPPPGSEMLCILAKPGLARAESVRKKGVKVKFEALLRNRSEINFCSISVAKTTACTSPTGYDADCQTVCP